jgi:peptide/nickel transport system permease protein
MARSRRLGYVEAARLAGAGGLDLVRRHIFPGMTRLLLAQAVLQLGLGILAEAGLSYVGLGTQPPATSLGLLLHDASAYASLKPGLLLAPGLAILVIVLALNVTSRGLRATAGPVLASEADDGAA